MRTGGETAAVAAVDNSAVWAMLARRQQLTTLSVPGPIDTLDR